MLTSGEIEEIREVIRKHVLAFTFDTLGPEELSREEIKVLERAGIVYGTGVHLVEDAYEFGKVAALLGSTAVTMGMPEIKRAVRKLTPMTDIERQAIKYASESAGQYIRGVGDLMIKDAGGLSARAGGSALRAIQDGVSETIANRRTTSQLTTDLFHLIDDKYRDWQRIAHTEINTAIQHGIYNEIRDKSDDGVDQKVFKRPNPDACKYCNALYLKEDGVTPKVFRLKDLADNNFGLKARSWRAVIGSVHPWCGCQLSLIPDGMDFEKKKTIKEPFEVSGKEYKRGSIIDEKEYDALSSDDKEKIGQSAVLGFTGETAKLDTEKSMNKLFVDDTDESVCGLC